MVELTIILLQVWPQEEVQEQGLAREALWVHPVVGDQGAATGRCGSTTWPTHLRRVPLVASQVYEDTYQAPYTKDAIDDDSEEDVIEDVYDIATREETQPLWALLQRYVVRYSNATICYPFVI